MPCQEQKEIDSYNDHCSQLNCCWWIVPIEMPSHFGVCWNFTVQIVHQQPCLTGIWHRYSAYQNIALSDRLWTCIKMIGHRISLLKLHRFYSVGAYSVLLHSFAYARGDCPKHDRDTAEMHASHTVRGHSQSVWWLVQMLVHEEG